MDFGTRLYNLITKKYRSLAAFARDAELISQQAVVNWCSGRNFPTVNHLYLIKDMLDCTWEDLLGQ